jgi:hypothetical protein
MDTAESDEQGGNERLKRFESALVSPACCSSELFLIFLYFQLFAVHAFILRGGIFVILDFAGITIISTRCHPERSRRISGNRHGILRLRLRTTSQFNF